MCSAFCRRAAHFVSSFFSLSLVSPPPPPPHFLPLFLSFFLPISCFSRRPPPVTSEPSAGSSRWPVSQKISWLKKKKNSPETSLYDSNGLCVAPLFFLFSFFILCCCFIIFSHRLLKEEPKSITDELAWRS